MSAGEEEEGTEISHSPPRVLSTQHSIQLMLQLIGVILVIVGPVIWWTMTQEKSDAVLTSKVETLNKDLSEERAHSQAFQDEMRRTLGELSKSLATMQGMLQAANVGKEPQRR